MSELTINRNIFIKAINRLRVRLFGNDSMKIFGITPETGETQIAELFENWNGRRTDSVDKESGSWIFQVIAADDWQTSQAFMLRIVSFTIGDRRWKFNKVQKPLGNSRVWKMKAEIQ